MKKALVVSLKFSPAHVSHLRAYVMLMSGLGFNVTLLLDKKYRTFTEKEEFFIGSNKIYFPEMPKENYDICLVYNSSVNNLIFTKLFKKKSKLLFVHHEPWGGKEECPTLFDINFKVALLFAKHVVNALTLRNVDKVLLPSNYAIERYYKNDIKYNGVYYYFPLIFDDEFSSTIDQLLINQKRFFSFIGTAVSHHGFQDYLDFIKNIYKQGLDKKYSLYFEIATRTDLTELISNDETIKKMIRDNSLTITHGRPLSNEEINLAYKRSFCVWLGYDYVTQSGVLPKAYMFGTPVLATKIGSFPEFLVDGKEGYFIDNKKDIIILGKLLDIKEHLADFSKNSREKFINTFYWNANINRMKNIIND